MKTTTTLPVMPLKCLLILAAVCGLTRSVIAADPPPGSPVAVNGQLRVEGCHIVNAGGEPVQLRGVCTHGLQWYADFYRSGGAIDAAATEWGADVVRLAVYVYEGGYLENEKLSPDDFDALIDGIVQRCIANGIYCIIDWHVHHPGDPGLYLEAAKAFFDKTARRYAGVPNLIYEIANEPNNTGLEGVAEGKDVRWSDITAYADEVIPVIRRHSPDAIVLVGTPDWCSFGLNMGRDWHDVVDHPLRHPNVAYVIHFYAVQHGFHEVIDQIAARLPLFATEWAASSHKRTSEINLVKAQPWLEMVNRRKIGWTYWNFTPSDGIFSAFKDTTTGEGPFSPAGDNVSDTGRLVYLLLNTPRDSWAKDPVGPTPGQNP